MPNSDSHRHELCETATDVAWRMRAYDAYGKNLATARSALRRRCPGFTEDDYDHILDEAIRLYDVIQTLVNERAAEFWAIYDSDRPDREVAINTCFDEHLADQFPDFPAAAFHSLVGMTFYYWHLR